MTKMMSIFENKYLSHIIETMTGCCNADGYGLYYLSITNRMFKNIYQTIVLNRKRSLMYYNIISMNMTQYITNATYHIDLSHSDLRDVSVLSGIRIHTLLLKCTSIDDASALINVNTLDLSYTNVSNVSMLGNVYDLNLSCTKVIDVSALTKVRILNLCNTGVIDVSMLGAVYDLNLSYTPVVDVSKLGKVHTLNLRCTNVSNISNLDEVKDLDISCTRVKDISTVNNKRSITLSSTDNTRSKLSRVVTINHD